MAPRWIGSLHAGRDSAVDRKRARLVLIFALVVSLVCWRIDIYELWLNSVLQSLSFSGIGDRRDIIP